MRKDKLTWAVILVAAVTTSTVQATEEDHTLTLPPGTLAMIDGAPTYTLRADTDVRVIDPTTIAVQDVSYFLHDVLATVDRDLTITFVGDGLTQGADGGVSVFAVAPGSCARCHSIYRD